MALLTSFEDNIITEMGNQMSKEIDFEILCSMLVEIGWTKIILRPMAMEDSYKVDQWTSKNIKGHFETMGLVWIFEKEQDANWFALRWL